MKDGGNRGDHRERKEHQIIFGEQALDCDIKISRRQNRKQFSNVTVARAFPSLPERYRSEDHMYAFEACNEA